MFDINLEEELNDILRISGITQLNENENLDTIYFDPTYSEFHKILKNTKYKKLSAIIDNNHIYCWDSAYAHHGSMIDEIERRLNMRFSNDAQWVRFSEPNYVWVSAEYFNDYDDDELEDLEMQEYETNLEMNPIIKKYFPNGVQLTRFNDME